MHEWIVCDGCAVFQSPFMMKTMGKSDNEHPLLHPPFLVLHQSSFVSVVFDFNAFLNDILPLFPKLFPVDLMRMEELIVYEIRCACCSFVFTTQIKFSECCV